MYVLVCVQRRVRLLIASLPVLGVQALGFVFSIERMRVGLRVCADVGWGRKEERSVSE